MLLWPVATIVPSLRSGFSRDNLIEIAGSLYLVGLYVCIRLLADSHMRRRFIDVASISAVIAAAFGVLGWLGTTMFGFESRLAVVRPYPYLGVITQAVGFTATPNMLASILMVGIVLCAAQCLTKGLTKVGDSDLKLRLAALVVLCGGFVLTFSKTVVCLVAALVVLAFLYLRTEHEHVYRTWIAVVAWGCVASCAVVYAIGSHVFVAEVGREDLSALGDESYISMQPLTTLRLGAHEYGVYPTNYLHNKVACLKAFVSSGGWGVGAGGHAAFVRELQSTGQHPPTFPSWPPHSTYLGALSELGLLGVLDIMLVGLGVGWVLILRLRLEQGFDPLVCGLAALFVGISIEAISTDIMRFRHYWWLLALVAELRSDVRREQRRATVNPSGNPPGGSRGPRR